MQDDAVLIFGWSDEFGGAYQPWVHNGKPSNIIRDHVSYLRVDTRMRRAKIDEWNQAVVWPFYLLPALLALLVWPAWSVWRRRQSTRLNAAWAGVDAKSPLLLEELKS